MGREERKEISLRSSKPLFVFVVFFFFFRMEWKRRKHKERKQEEKRDALTLNIPTYWQRSKEVNMCTQRTMPF